MNARTHAAYTKSRSLLAGLALLALGSGCAGARARVVAPDAAVPVSLSPAVRGADGALVPQSELRKVGTFHYEATAWSTFYTAIPLARRKDISKAISEQAKAAGGTAVVNLSVTASTCAMNFIVPFAWLPMWPGCSNVEIQGDIVRHDPSLAKAPADSMLAEARHEVFLYDRCALIDEPNPDYVVNWAFIDAKGRVRSRVGTFVCTELPPGMDDTDKANFVPASLERVLCLDVPHDQTCLAARDPALAAQHAEQVATRARAQAEAELPAAPPAAETANKSKRRGSRHAKQERASTSR